MEIVTEFGSFIYNHLHMEMYDFADIFQAKVDELLSAIKVIKTYIHDILFLIQERFYNNTDKLRVIFHRLYDAGLKVNAPMCNFGLKKIP